MKKKTINIIIGTRLIIVEVGAKLETDKWNRFEGFSIYHSPADKPLADDLSNATLIKTYPFKDYDEGLKAATAYVKAYFNKVKKDLKSKAKPKPAVKKKSKPKKK